MIRNEIIAIQYLRGLAASAVVLDHVNGMMFFPKYFGRNCGNFWNYGATGVNLFFIISGFIISFISLEEKSGKLSPRSSLSDFAIKRIARIIPIMWIAILTYIFAREIGRNANLDFSYLRALFLVPFGTVEPNNIWTLRHEAIFYSLFALSFMGSGPKQGILIAWAIAPIVYSLFSLPQQPESVGFQFIRIVSHPSNVEFSTGVLIGLIWHKWTKHFQWSLPFSSGFFVFFAYILFWIFSYEFNIKVDNLNSVILSSIIGGAMIFFFVHLNCSRGAFDKILRYLGEASFSIYLFHLHFASAVLGIFAKYAHMTAPALVLIVTSLVAMVGSIVIYELVEKPVHRASSSFFSRNRVPHAA